MRRLDSPGQPQRRAVFGLIVIAFGVLALLDKLDLFDIHRLQAYWPMVLVAVGASRLAWPRGALSAFFGVVLIVVGGVLTLNNLGYLTVHLRDWWPVLVILAGLSIVTRSFSPRNDRDQRGSAAAEGLLANAQGEHDARVSIKVVLSSSRVKNDSQAFQGGQIEVVMGNLDLDLRQASISGEASLTLSSVMGGVVLRVPSDWQVTVRGTPVLGSIEDHSVPSMIPGKRLNINAEIVMGGLELTN